MKGIGAILAGGRSERFGSDKADARLDGRRLIDWVADALTPQVVDIVICGRDEPGQHCLADRPEPGIGPLGGLAAALHYAAKNDAGFVVSTGCDTPDIPPDLLDYLTGEGAAILDDQPVIGFWPVRLVEQLDAFIADGGRSLYGFADHVGARRITLDHSLANINRPDDLTKIGSDTKS